MKKIMNLIIFAIVLSMIFLPNVNALADTIKSNSDYTNSNGVVFSAEQYKNFMDIGFSIEELEVMSQETYDEYGIIEIGESASKTKYFRETLIKEFYNERVIVEEISENEYENGMPTKSIFTSGSHETTYKKLTVTITKTSTTNPAARAVNSTLTWKLVPAVKSYDIYAARVTGGEIGATGYSGRLVSTQKVPSGPECGYLNSQDFVTTFAAGSSNWNTKASGGLGFTGIGWTGLLTDRSAYCIYDIGMVFSYVTKYTASLNFIGSAVPSNGEYTAFVSYQHAVKNVSFNSVVKGYDFSASGLGKVIYFNNTLKDSYDGMGGVSVTL